MSEIMSVNNLSATLHIAEKLERVMHSGEEIPQALPPGEAVGAYAVDEYPGCPNNWMNGSNMASSYFLAVKEEKGMWLNFNKCVYHNHDVAVVVSVQGINPITGQKMVGDNPLRLEQYKKQCPIHKVDFKQDRFCEECGFKWPAQNYIATTGTPMGLFWIDGFRNADGSVRQYIFTEEEMKGVASQMIGNDRVYAIGIAFYLSKEAKPAPVTRRVGRGWVNPDQIKYGGGLCSPGVITYDSGYHNYGGPTASAGENDFAPKAAYGMNMLYSKGVSSGENLDQLEGMDFLYLESQEDCSRGVEDIVAECCEVSAQSVESVKPITPVKKLEVGAGALIDQEIYVDPKDIDYWESSPAGMIYINYCDGETLKRILQQGRRKEKANGFMEGLKVGD